MKMLVLTIVGILFCFTSSQGQQRRGGFDCWSGMARNVNLDQLGEKIKLPIDPCKLAEFDKYDHMLVLPYDKPTEKKPLIKITDFVNSQKNRSAIGPIMARQQHNQARYGACSIRLKALQSSVLAAFGQKIYSKNKNKQEPARVSTPLLYSQGSFSPSNKDINPS